MNDTSYVKEDDVKIPEGTSIQTPAKEKSKESGLRMPQFGVSPELPLIIYPHYTNNAKTELACILLPHSERGPGTGIPVREGGIPKDPKHPLYGDIKKQYSDEEIDHNTRREQHLQSEAQKAATEAETEKKQHMQREELWSIKQEFLNMDVMKSDENKFWRRKIRKATTTIQAQAYGIACIIKDAENSE
tara:strand:+ start:1499 stop:2065 length:567 start_codon:yes stop_codon:yes gene_type:complete